MVAHQTIGMNGAASIVGRTRQPVEVKEKILFGVETHRAGIAALDDMERNSWENQAGTTGQDELPGNQEGIHGNTENTRGPSLIAHNTGRGL